MDGRNTRSSIANNANPPNETADEVTRQLNTALSNLLTQLVQALRGNRVNQREATPSCIIKSFRASGAKEFFDTEESQVEFAASMLQGRVLTWCNTLVQTQGWAAEFWNHKMVGSDIDGYITRFHELARLVPYMVTPESQRVNRYIRGLAPEIKSHVTSSEPATIQGANRNRGMDDRNKRQRTGKNFALTTPEQGQGVELEGHTFIIDLIPFGYGSFDVRVGMDWLSKLRAKIVCYEKIVQIPLPNGSILEVHGERPEGNLKQLKAIKVNELKLEDIPVVREFTGVFPKDLSGLPPSREVEFHIDLIPGAMPIAKSPYHLAPTDMQELSNQLKELQEKSYGTHVKFEVFVGVSALAIEK
uniref:Putative reverse transcriptase domain-containing protein n=1 Tax=Tanacetum cinerariifolium TaxID=118510 RepID=A0A699IHM2_TANCI|nr:putative reverse transcriptase domain-containing protein [Tanacetum cinerariifolium]